MFREFLSLIFPLMTSLQAYYTCPTTPVQEMLAVELRNVQDNPAKNMLMLVIS